MYSVYLAKSTKNNKVYVGLTSRNPKERIKEHNSGSNKWSRANKPFKLVYFETFVCKEDAGRREKFFKSGVGKKLKKIILKNFDTQ
jgi:putative endonuclease